MSLRQMDSETNPARAGAAVAPAHAAAEARPATDGAQADPPRFGWLARLVGRVVAALMALRHASWRKDLRDAAGIDRRLAAGERFIAVFWHGKYPPLFTLLGGRRACAFASLSFRGQVIAEVCRRFGHACELLPYKGGKRSRALMRAALARHAVGAIAVDGPLGPYHVPKSGAIEMASELGHALLPISMAAARRKINTGRWDRMEMPRLFSRVVLAVGEPIHVPPGLGQDDHPVWLDRVRQGLDAADARAERLIGRA